MEKVELRTGFLRTGKLETTLLALKKLSTSEEADSSAIRS
jgi:hypothetical protein